MSATRMGAADREAVILSDLTNSELGAVWVEVLRLVADELPRRRRGRERRWAAVGRDPRVRVVEAEWTRRRRQAVFEAELHDAAGHLFR